MKQLNIQTTIDVFESVKELDKNEQLLVKAAFDATVLAYAPYSQFFVGAAVLLENGEIIKGANQENSSFPISLCAERTALGAAGNLHPGVAPLKIAITARTDAEVIDRPVPPCGACRQVIAEQQQRYKKPIVILMASENGLIYRSKSIADLLPLMFDATYF